MRSAARLSLAEKMAGVQLEGVLLSISAGRLGSHLVEAASQVHGGSVTDDDLTRATTATAHHGADHGRTVLHALPVGYSLDGVRGVRDPRGMVAPSSASK